MKLDYRNYKCGVCGNEEQVQTNHIGEIYSECKYCGNGVRFCLDAPKRQVDKRVIFNFYCFDISNEDEEIRYNNLLELMKSKNYKKFEEVAPYCIEKYTKKWKMLKLKDKTQFNIYNANQFNGQYVSDGIRLFDWRECVFSNKRIKQGYYLTEL